MSSNRVVTKEELAKHNNKNDFWIVLEGRVYDVTRLLPIHPGGATAITNFARSGRDATEMFLGLHPKGTLTGPYKKHITLIGVLQTDSAPAAATSAPPQQGDAKTASGAASTATVMNRPLLSVPKPGDPESLTCGGTAHILPEERKKATFSVELMTNAIDGSAEATKRRRFILTPLQGLHQIDKVNMDRSEYFRSAMKHFFEVHESFYGTYKPTKDELVWMSENSTMTGSLINHYAIFYATLLGQGTDEQIKQYAVPAVTCKITGAYVQTEMGHGSNVRGLRTTATYDREAQQFVLNTPTLRSIKWWPGTIGRVATHAVVYAQLVIDGKELGIHAFIMQVRDEHHKALPGIEMGDVGPKLGDAANDTGYMILQNVRIPRTDMLRKNSWVEPDGTYVVSENKKKNAKIAYSTMMFTRGFMVRIAAGRLAIAATIAARYSCIREQGFKVARSKAFMSPENKIMDYDVQRYRVLRQVALAYAMKFTGKWMTDEFERMAGRGGDQLNAEIKESKFFMEIFATSAALKAFVTAKAADGMEDLRRACGGNGYLLCSGIAGMQADYVMNLAAEGDYVVMMTQAGRFLLKCLSEASRRKPVFWLCDYLQAVGNPITYFFHKGSPTRYTDAGTFQDLDHLLRLHKYRALHATMKAGSIFQRVSKTEGRDAAWNACARQLVEAVTAHCSQTLLRIFMMRIDTLTSEAKGNEKQLAVVAVLRQLAALYGLNVILDENWGGLLSSSEMDGAKAAVVQLLGALRPNVVAMVDAFDISDTVLCSTIGRQDGNVYEALLHEARKSVLNLTDPFDGYADVLAPRLDKELIRRGAESFRALNAKL